MELTKEWLETTGTKISAEDIRQMQLLYEKPEETLGSVVGTRSLYLSAEGALYQCVEYDDEQRTNERYPAGIELALDADEVERLRSGDRNFENYQSCLSEEQKTAIWTYLRDPETFRTVHRETERAEDHTELTIKFGKGCMKEFERTNESGEAEKFAEIRFKDGEQWRSFVVPRRYVHENKFGKGLWLKRYAEGKTKVTAYDPGTKERTEEYIGNRELKKKVESYKHQKKMTR